MEFRRLRRCCHNLLRHETRAVRPSLRPSPWQGEGALSIGTAAEEIDFRGHRSRLHDTLDILRGNLPRRAHSMVVEWALAHRAELRANWNRAREQRPLEQIEPLD